MIQNGAFGHVHFQIHRYALLGFRVSRGRDNTRFVAVKGASGLLIGFPEFSSNENITPHMSDRFAKDLSKTEGA